MMRTLESSINEHIETMGLVAELESPIKQAMDAIEASFKNGKSLFACGNGGSASDAQHFASELSGRFEQTRPGYPATALTTDSSALTAIANDFGFERIFARQLESLGREGDVLVAISTSGNSGNMSEVVRQAKKQNITSIALAGRDGGEIAKLADISIVVPTQRTSRIQEAHIFILHYLCEIFEPS